MQLAAATQRTDLRFTEPVRNLLNHKGHAVWSVAPETTVFEAIQIMSEKHVGALLVMRGGALAGIVSERDYARKVILKGRNSQSTTVKEIMSQPVMFVTPGQSVDECMQLMTQRRVRHLPVVDGDRVIGVLSIGDVVNWIVDTQNQTIEHLRSYIDGTYPG